MIELIGGIILLLAAWLIGSDLINNYKTKSRELEALYDMVAYIRDNIEYRMKPLPDIFDVYTNEYLEHCGFLEAVRKTDLSQAWLAQKFALNGEAYRLIEDFIKEIGSGYQAEEVRLCEYTLARLHDILEKNHADATNQLKLFRTVPVMFALSIILILI